MKRKPFSYIRGFVTATALFWAIADRGSHLALAYQRSGPHTNQLCIGDCYVRNGGRDEVRIGWELSTDFDHSTKDDIYALRERRVNERPELLAGSYTPSRPIFGLIVNHLRWWGFDGYYRHLRSNRRGELSSGGKSLRGEEIINPFYLASLKIQTLSIANPDFHWNESSSPSAEGGVCPYWAEKSDVYWRPGKRQAEVTYYVKDYAKKLEDNRCLQKHVFKFPLALDIDPVNAEDFGLFYLAFSERDSVNVSYDRFRNEPRRLNFFYHRGTSCAHPDGCNNISPFVKEFGMIDATNLPARMAINLWEKEPASAATPPDFQYIINLE